MAIKEEGTHSPAEGLLARFAQILTIKSRMDLLAAARATGDVVLVDVKMPSFDAAEVLEAFAQSQRSPLIMLFDSGQAPSELLRQFSKLGVIASAQSRRNLSFPCHRLKFVISDLDVDRNKFRFCPEKIEPDVIERAVGCGIRPRG